MKKIKTKLELIKAADKYHRPHKSQFKRWFAETVNHIAAQSQLSEKLNSRIELDVCVRLVEKEEMQHLAAQFRHKSKATTVLSFPCEDSISLKLPHLGDIAMCGEAILEEASNQHLDVKQHWAFLFIHSVLHLFGFHHGERMKRLENSIMTNCNLSLPHPNIK